jgi:hypothetical protein
MFPKHLPKSGLFSGPEASDERGVLCCGLD